MKILHITTHLNTGGITTYLRSLIREQAKAGHEVFLWASTGVCLEEFEKITKAVVSNVPRCKSELSPRLWQQLSRLVSYLREEKIDIVHTHTRVAQVLAAAAKQFCGVPYLSTAHMFYKRRLGRRLFPCWGSAVIANSETMKSGLCQIFGEKNLPPVTVAVNGIDVETLRAKTEAIERSTVREKFGCREDETVVLSLARLIPVKGAHLLIESFAMALKEFASLRLLLAGTGEEVYEYELRTRIKNLRIEEKVCFLGNVVQPEKAFRAADIFAAPYLWPEAFGLSILEAMAAGVPVIGSRSGGIGELLGQGKYGLLFDEKDVMGLATCILDYAKRPELRMKMAKAGGEAAFQFTAKKMYERIQEVYERVVRAQ